MNVVIYTPVLSVGDAIGNDILAMAKILRRQGHTVLYSARWESTLPVVPIKKVPDILRSPDDLIIFHHSIGCEDGVRMFERLGCRKVVRYHNVTPAKFFRTRNKKTADACDAGLEQLRRLLGQGTRLWVDSEFNGRDARRIVANVPYDVLSPFNQVEQLLEASSDRAGFGLYEDWVTNILVVGRVVPNKNITTAVEAFRVYLERHEPQARLFLAGDLSDHKYTGEVIERIKELELGDRVFVTGKVSVEQLKAFFLSAQVLLTTSLHEGFCVPLVEAMALRVPIVALPNAAIPDTAGDVAVYPEDDSPEAIAAAINVVRSNGLALEDRLNRGWHRYQENFTNRAIEAKFLKLFNEVIGASERDTVMERVRCGA